MAAATQINDVGLRLIAEFEGFSPVPYNDPVGHCTVGYGELLHLGNCTPAELARPPITADEGRRRLREKVKPYVDAVVRSTRPLNANELGALASLCYNIGPGGYINSRVRVAVNAAKDPCYALREIIRGTNGVVYPGLVRRREAECKLFHAPAIEEDEDMAERVWNSDLKQTWLIGKFGAAPVLYPAMDEPLIALYGGHTKALTNTQLEAMRVKP